MEEKVNVWKANMQNGFILGLTGVVYTLLLYFSDLLFSAPLGYLSFLIYAVILFFLIKSYRNNYLHGYITYGASLGAGVIIFLYFSIIYAVFIYILYKFIDPGLTAKKLAFIEEMIVRRNPPQQALDAAMALQRKLNAPEFSAPLSIFNSMFIGTILSLIVSIFTRKEGNPLVDAPTN